MVVENESLLIRFEEWRAYCLQAVGQQVRPLHLWLNDTRFAEDIIIGYDRARKGWFVTKTQHGVSGNADDDKQVEVTFIASNSSRRRGAGDGGALALRAQNEGQCNFLASAQRFGEHWELSLWYPRNEGEVNEIVIGSQDAVCDDLLVTYDFERDGYVLKQMTGAPGLDFAEVAFVSGQSLPAHADNCPEAPKPTVPEVLPFLLAFRNRPENSNGGNLHILVCDGNVETGHVQFCKEEAQKSGDSHGVALADLLLRMSKTQRLKLHGFYRQS